MNQPLACKRVLLVDDNPDDLHQLERCLRKLGADTTCALDGREALRVMGDSDFELVISDISMPEMNGVELAETLSARGVRQRVPIMFVSGVASRNERADAIRAGGVSVIDKPVDPDLLHSYVEAIERQAKERREVLEALEEIKRASETDYLTGLLNRRGLDQSFSSALESACQINGSVSLFLLDIDRFKPYNDYYGHVAGDEVLVRVATELASRCRRVTDLVGRFGGEEFAIMAMSLQPHEAQAFGEVLVGAIRDLSLPHAQAGTGVLTVSLGVVTSWPVSQQGPATAGQLYELIDAADRALYRAKTHGGDCVFTEVVTAVEKPQRQENGGYGGT